MTTVNLPPFEARGNRKNWGYGLQRRRGFPPLLFPQLERAADDLLFGFDGSIGTGKAQEGFTSFKGLSEGFRRL